MDGTLFHFNTLGVLIRYREYDKQFNAGISQSNYRTALMCREHWYKGNCLTCINAQEENSHFHIRFFCVFLAADITAVLISNFRQFFLSKYMSIDIYQKYIHGTEIQSFQQVFQMCILLFFRLKFSIFSQTNALWSFDKTI